MRIIQHTVELLTGSKHGHLKRESTSFLISKALELLTCKQTKHTKQKQKQKNSQLKNPFLEAGEVAQRLKVCSALPEDPSLDPSTNNRG